MTLQDMLAAINRRTDEIVLTADAIDWLNEGQNVMAVAIGARFPAITNDSEATFVFDEKYHMIPVLFACGRYKEKDTSLQEARSFMAQFEEMKKEFVENYELPPRYRDDRLSQQFEAVDGQTTFTITKPGYNYVYGDLKVYVNDGLVEVSKVNKDNTFVLKEAANDGDAVTAVWEEHQDLIEPPYNWWRW